MSEGERTVDAGPDMLDDLRRMAAAAEAGRGEPTSTGPPMPDGSARPAPRPTTRPSDLDVDDVTPVSAPRVPVSTNKWRPPERSVLTTATPTSGTADVRLWRLATLAFAAIAALLAAVVLFGAIRGGA